MENYWLDPAAREWLFVDTVLIVSALTFVGSLFILITASTTLRRVKITAGVSALSLLAVVIAAVFAVSGTKEIDAQEYKSFHDWSSETYGFDISANEFADLSVRGLDVVVPYKGEDIQISMKRHAGIEDAWIIVTNDVLEPLR